MGHQDLTLLTEGLLSRQGSGDAEHHRIVDIAERFVALIDSGDMDGLLGLMSDEIVIDDPVGIVHLEGKSEARSLIPEGRKAAETALKLTGPVRTRGVSQRKSFPRTARAPPQLTSFVVEAGGRSAWGFSA